MYSRLVCYHLVCLYCCCTPYNSNGNPIYRSKRFSISFCLTHPLLYAVVYACLRILFFLWKRVAEMSVSSQKCCSSHKYRREKKDAKLSNSVYKWISISETYTQAHTYLPKEKNFFGEINSSRPACTRSFHDDMNAREYKKSGEKTTESYSFVWILNLLYLHTHIAVEIKMAI